MADDHAFRRSGLVKTNPTKYSSLGVPPDLLIVKKGPILDVAVSGAMTRAWMPLIQDEATHAMDEKRASACLIDLATCIVEFEPSCLAVGFLMPRGERPDDRPCALVVSQQHCAGFTTVARDAARRGVLMPVFTNRESASRFLKAQAPLWWTDRRYHGTPPGQRRSVGNLSRD